MASKRVMFEDFGGGIDRREGIINRDARKQYDIENAYVNAGRKIQRRMRAEKVAGQLPALSKDLLYLNGTYVTFAPKGASAVSTLPLPVTVFYFDVPPYANGNWELINAVVFNEQVVALISHGFTGAGTTEILRYHVWDEEVQTKPTYVEDGAPPAYFSPIMPQMAYGKEDRQAVPRSYRPTLCILGGRVLVSRGDGGMAHSAVLRPRVFSERTASQIQQDGRYWYLQTPSSVGAEIFEFTVGVNFDDLSKIDRWAGYVLEQYVDGLWYRVPETSGAPTGGNFRVLRAANRWNPTGDPETLIQVDSLGGRADSLLRFRLIAKPQVTVKSGCYVLPTDIQFVGGILTYQGASKEITSKTLKTLTGSTYYYFVINANGTPSAVVDTSSATAWPSTFFGGDRYDSRIVARAKTNPAGTDLDLTFTGTATINIGSSSVIGAGTLFRSEARIGQQITIAGEQRTIAQISSDTQLEVDSAYAQTLDTQSIIYDPSWKYGYEIGETGNEWYADTEAEAITLAGDGDAGFLNCALYDETDGVPVAAGGLQNRLLIQFPTSVQLWQFEEDIAKTLFLAKSDPGAGTNPKPFITPLHTMLVTDTPFGPQGFMPAGNNKDYIEPVRLGDLLQGLDLPQFTTGIWWGRHALLVLGSAGSGDIWVLTYMLSAKISAWCRWNIEGLTSVDRIFESSGLLHIVSGRDVYIMDGLVAPFRDSTDTDLAYKSRVRSLYNDLGKPADNKRLVATEIGQVGTSTMRVYVNPYEEGGDSVSGPVCEGLTTGRQRVPIMAMGPAIAVEVESRDEAGHRLDFVGFDYILAKR